MRIIKNILSSIPFGPVLFSLSFVLAIVEKNIDQINPNLAISPMLVVSLFALIVYGASLLILRDKYKAIVYSSFFLLTFFSYREYSLIGYLYIARVSTLLGRNDIFFSAWILFMGLALILINKIQKPMTLIGNFLTVVATILTLFILTNILTIEALRYSQPKAKSPMPLPQIDISLLNKEEFPDIYYLVPDSYSSSTVLMEKFQYNNSSFVGFLEKNGFYVPKQSTSNYPKTVFSLSSSLNMEYLDYLSIYSNSSDLTIVNPLFKENNVMKTFKNLGYSTYQLGSWWEPTSINPYADHNFYLKRSLLGNFNELDYIILQSTPLDPFLNKFFPNTDMVQDQDRRDRIIYQFEKIPEIAKKSGPKFVFAHILAPHDPYVFDTNCAILNSTERAKKMEGENYINQIGCINQKLENIINLIISSSSHPPVILLQSDEGVPFIKNVLENENWKNASDEQLQEKFPIFSAYLLPEDGPSPFYDTITPVNSFRIVFNKYFSTNLPLLPDNNYIFADLQHPYQFSDITKQLSN